MMMIIISPACTVTHPRPLFISNVHFNNWTFGKTLITELHTGGATVPQPLPGDHREQHEPRAAEGGQGPVRHLHLRGPQLGGGRRQQPDNSQRQGNSHFIPPPLNSSQVVESF